MNDANTPLSNMDFPNVMSSDAVKRQASYSQSAGSPGVAEGANMDALINLVQDLNQQNHELLNRVSVLEGELAVHRETMSQSEHGIKTGSDSSSSGSFESPGSAGSGAANVGQFNAEQIAELLNQLEFAQQARQRQDIRVETLTTQLASCQVQVEQLESENDDLQQRCGGQLCRLNHLEEECRDLRLRLQRQQRYTLQFKAALEKCLEVPPPSYGFFHGRDYDHDMIEPLPEMSGESADCDVFEHEAGRADSEDSNWLVQPLFPKLRNIKPWGRSQVVATLDHFSGEDDPGTQGNALSSHSESADLRDSRDAEASEGVAYPPSDRFQSILLTLADEAMPTESAQSEQCIDESAAVSPPVFSDVVDSGDEADIAEPSPQDPLRVEQSVSDGHDSITAEPVPEALDSLGVDAASLEAESHEREAIAPFSSMAFAGPGSPEVSPASGDDKLWQSLVNLIDMSAPDGLKVPSASSDDGEAPVAEKGMHLDDVSQTAQDPIANPWFADQLDSSDLKPSELNNQPAEIAPLQPDSDLESPLSGAEVASPSIMEHSPEEQEADPQAQLKEKPEAQKTPIRRVIELPTFLTPGQGVNPNPA